MEWWEVLETVDKAQVISAIATAIAAVAASITTFQSYTSTKRQEEERHALVKPNFVVTSTFEDTVKKSYKINIENIGYNVLNNIIAKWDGDIEADVEIE